MIWHVWVYSIRSTFGDYIPSIVNSTDVVKLGLHTKKIHLYFVSVSHFLQNTSLWTLTTHGDPAFALLSRVGHVPTAIRAPEASCPPPFSPAVGNNTYPFIRISVPSSVLFGPNPTPNPTPTPPQPGGHCWCWRDYSHRYHQLAANDQRAANVPAATHNPFTNPLEVI